MSNELTVYKNKEPDIFLYMFYENIFDNYINYYKKNELLIKLLGVYLFRKFIFYFI